MASVNRSLWIVVDVSEDLTSLKLKNINKKIFDLSVTVTRKFDIGSQTYRRSNFAI